MSTNAPTSWHVDMYAFCTCATGLEVPKYLLALISSPSNQFDKPASNNPLMKLLFFSEVNQKYPKCYENKT